MSCGLVGYADEGVILVVWGYCILHFQVFPFSFSSDGMGRTGAFITIHAMMERLKAEHVVDFFQLIKSSRTQRPNFVSNVVSTLHLAHLPTHPYPSSHPAAILGAVHLLRYECV